VKRIENALARIWPWLAVAALGCMLAACAYTVRRPDGTYEEVGRDAIEGVTVGSDTIGAVVEAVQPEAVQEAVEDAASGNWLAVGVTVLGVIVAAVGGYKARKRWRRNG
jgi:hypothetical protein